MRGLTLALLATPVTLTLAEVIASNALDVSLLLHRQLASQALSCSLQSDIDFVGNDIGNVAGAAADCCSKCQAQSGCGAFTWTSYNGGTCWLKSAKGEAKTNAGALSAVVSSWIVEDGIDYLDNDIGNVAGATSSNCTASCLARSGCSAFTWTSYNGGTCWLKSARGSTRTNPSASSGVLSASATNVTTLTPTTIASACPVMEQNTDYTGADISNAAGAGVSDCCAKCTTITGCGAFTWTLYNGGTCWFKSSKGSAKASAGAVSAVVTTASTPVPTVTPHIQTSLRSGTVPSRSVNLGGWLVGEYWMSKTSPAWTGLNETIAYSGEYIAMQALGKDKGTKQFEAHRATWITEDDIREIRDVGLNMVRVPVGFWIVDDIDGVQPTAISQVYARGALKYLDTLIHDWAVKYNVAVMLSLHSHQGSQNGNDHSAPQTLWAVDWSKDPANYDNSLRLATKLAERYKDAPAFLGLGLMNEPTNVDFEQVKRFYIEAYNKIRATGNDCVLAVAPQLWFQNSDSLRDFMRWPQYYNVWNEWHVYYKWNYEDQNEQQILSAVRNFHTGHFDDWPGNYVFMGEWSLGNPDEKLFTDRSLQAEFASAQLESFQPAHAGWAFWSWHHDDEKIDGFVSGWSLRQLLRLGIMTVPT